MIAVVFALEFEAADFAAILGRRLCVDLWILGVCGQRAAASLEERLDQTRPDIVVSAGLGGGLVRQALLGDVYLCDNYTSPLLLKSLESFDSLQRAAVATVPYVLTLATEKQELAASTGAVVGDMETAWLSDVCRNKGIPFLSLRAISDVAGEDLPVPGPVLIDPETGRPAPEKLFRYLLKNPRAAFGLNRLVSNTKMARKNLSNALEAVLPSLLRVEEGLK